MALVKWLSEVLWRQNQSTDDAREKFRRRVLRDTEHFLELELNIDFNPKIATRTPNSADVAERRREAGW
jgi:hypothetical protein